MCRRTKGSGQSLWVLLTLHPPPRTGQRRERRGRPRAPSKGADARFGCLSRFCGRLRGQGGRPKDGGRKGQSAGRQVSSSPPRPAPGEGGAGQPSQSTGGRPGLQPRPPPTPHMHHGQLVLVSGVGGSRDSAANRNRSRSREPLTPADGDGLGSGRGQAHPVLPALPGAGCCGISAAGDAQGDPRPACPLLHASPRQGPFWKPRPLALDFAPVPSWGRRREAARQTPARQTRERTSPGPGRRGTARPGMGEQPGVPSGQRWPLRTRPSQARRKRGPATQASRSGKPVRGPEP